MEIFLLIVLLIFVIIIISKQKKNNLINQIEIRNLSFKIDDLKKQLEANLTGILTKNVSDEVSKITEKEQATFTETKSIELDVPDAIKVTEDTEKTSPQIQSPIIIEDKPLSIAEDSEKETSTLNQKIFIETQLNETNKTWFEKFKDKNPDVEKFIGENLISKIGILILVLGISFFVKYSIDNDWINEPARVGIGILAGSIVMFVANKLRDKFPAFSSVFVAGAISIFYFTIGIAYHDYGIFSQTVAFIIMVIITAFSALVSVHYNRKELAILTLIGGFAVPFMVSSGQGNYSVLFTYITILNIGMLIISYYKKWDIVTLLAFIFTYLIFGIWFRTEIHQDSFPYAGAIFFASIIYFIFSIAVVINNVRSKGKFSKIEYSIMLVNTLFYFGIGATIFQNWHMELKGIFTISIAVYNLIFGIILFKKFGVHKNAIYFLLGLALSFITLTIPFQFNGSYITLFWACEGVLLLWLSQKSKIATFKAVGIIVQCLLIISLFIDWSHSYLTGSNLNINPFLNSYFITGLVVIISFVASYILLKKEKENTEFYSVTINNKIYKYITLCTAIALGYLVGMFEVNYQVKSFITNQASSLSYILVFHYLFTSVLIYYLFKYNKKANSLMAIFLVGLNLVLYFISHRLVYNEIYNDYEYGLDNSSAYINHYIIFACLIFCFYTLFKNRKDKALENILQSKSILWIFTFSAVFILSNEIMIHALVFSVDNIKSMDTYKEQIEDINKYSRLIHFENKLNIVQTRVIKVGFPILWGLLSFVLLMIGIKKQVKQLRIIALVLLGLTIIKLFIFDINVSGPGRIIAFILLGILTLVISLAYQKLNKNTTEESKKNTDEKDD